mgnify:CR=1 FL=1
MTTKRDLALAYSPGVAAPVKMIAENPESAYDYTSKGNLVAVISNGSAILGMGKLGALASKPVMEGKAVLFKRFADIDAIDLEIDSNDSNEIINSIKNFSKSFGGINLEDIAAPDCFIIEKKLKKIAEFLETERPNAKWKICVDTSSFLDKAWAEEAGIGWIGKHSNIINSKLGSWMFLGHLLTTEDMECDKPSKPLCGECEKCIEACPTKAIEEPFIVNSNKCLAYHTLENREKKLPKNIIDKMGNWIAGCDICQEVCPWNEKFSKISSEKSFFPKTEILDWSEKKWMDLDNTTFKKLFKGSAVKRTKFSGLQRNIKQNSS